MNDLKKQALVTAGIIAAFGLAVMTSSTVFAQSETGDKGFDTIVQKIAQKFNLKESDVKAVFDEERQTRMAEMEAKYSERLNELVSDGKITEAQKNLIIEKHKELASTRQSNMDSMKNLTDEERKAAMEKNRSNLESWAKSNGIDIEYLMPMGGHGVGHGPR